MGCAPGKENQLGLCYDQCKPATKGVGPVCWGACPAGKTDCGAICADSTLECFQKVGDSIKAFGNALSNVVKTLKGDKQILDDPKYAEEQLNMQATSIENAIRDMKATYPEMVEAAKGDPVTAQKTMVGFLQGQVPALTDAAAGKIAELIIKGDAIFHEDVKRLIMDLDPLGIYKAYQTIDMPLCS
jgi:hypothetical protein